MAELRTNSDLITHAEQRGTLVLARVAGEIDLHNSPDFRGDLLQMYEQAKPAKIVLNFEKVPYVDSSAIAVLVEMLQRLRKSKGEIYLTNLQPRVKSLLEIARLETIFKIVATEDDAMK